jgi:hypothetical protein
VVSLNNLEIANIRNTSVFSNKWISEVDVGSKPDALVTPEAVSLNFDFFLCIIETK